MEKITGIILAGGKSSRMGEEKGLVTFENKKLIEYSIAVFEQMNYEIIIIANDSRYEQFGYPVFQDIVHEKGPLGGLYTGLHHSKTNWNAILTCDLPKITTSIFKELEKEIFHENDYDVVFSSYKDRINPLTALYNTSAKEKIKSCIDNDKLKVRLLQGELNIKTIPFSNKYANNFININSKNELLACK